MDLSRYDFDILAHVEEGGKQAYFWRDLVDEINISGTQVFQSRAALAERGLLLQNGDFLSVTEEGLAALEPYRVKRAVIFAAGFGSRMVPVTLETPKPLVKVHGVRIIDRLIDALLARDITDITIVRGYLKERFDELLEKYPLLQFRDNDRYGEENNISSALAAGEKADNCYICAGDLLLTNPSLIKKYQYRTNYLASYALETDDWCFDFQNGFAANYRKGGTYCFNAYEITYWSEEDSARLRADWRRAYESKGGSDLFWEYVPLAVYPENYQVEIRPCRRTDIIEIDNFYELEEIDSSYRHFPDQT